VQRLCDQLHADEAEDDRKPDVEVDEPVEQAAEQEVQLAQPHQGERVRAEDQERLLGQPEDGRDRVEREEEVGGADRQHHDQHRRDVPLAVDLREDLGAVVLLGDRDHPAHQPEHQVLLVALLVLLPAEGQLVSGVEEERAEEVEDPLEPLDHRGAGGDEQAAQDERGEDAEEQHLVLVDRRHREGRHDDDEDEEVVDAEAVLGDVAGEELARVPPAGEEQDPEPEEDRENDVESHPPGGLADPDRMRIVVDDEEVDREQQQNAGDRGQPEPSGNVHGPPPDGQHRSLPEVSPAAPAAGGTGSGRADRLDRGDDAAAQGYSPPRLFRVSPMPDVRASRPDRGCRGPGGRRRVLRAPRRPATWCAAA
jgi:hypothetical protein